jgi:iron(III) transport system permease protein
MVNRVGMTPLRRYLNFKTIVLGVLILIVAGLVIVPSFFLFVGSFTSGNPFEKERSLTLDNYIRLFMGSRFFNLVGNTLWITIWTTVFSVGAGAALAWIITRTDVPLADLLSQLIMIPFYFSPFIGGICWSILAAPRVGLINMVIISLVPSLQGHDLLNAYTPTGIIWTMTLYFTPFVFLFTVGALSSMDPSLEESSKIFGANNWRTATRITLPLVLPAISGGALLVFILAVGQFGVPAILGIPGKYYVLTTEMYQLLSEPPPDYALVAAFGVILFGMSALLVYLQSVILGKRQFTTVTGKGFRPRKVRMGNWRFVFLGVCLFYILISVVLPLAAVLWVSLVKFLVPKLSAATYTLKHYKNILFIYPPTKLAIKNSMILALVGASIGMIFCGGISWILHRTRTPGRKTLEYISMFPIAIPSVVFAVALLWTWINVPLIYGTIWLLLICYITVYLPYGIKSTSATLLQIDKSLEECAYVCGASWTHTLRTVTIPLLKPGIIGGWTLMFIVFSRELASSLFLSTSKSVVMSVAIFDLYYQGVWNKLGALSILQVIIVFSMLAVTRKIGGAGVRLS